MEFERALFRVYERSIESIMSEEDVSAQSEPIYKKSCKLFQLLIFFCTLFLLSCFLYLHITYVGNKGCLYDAILAANSSLVMVNSSFVTFPRDVILGINTPFTRVEEESTDDAFTSNSNEGSKWIRNRLRRLESDWILLDATNAKNGSENATQPRRSYNFDYVVTFDRGITFLSDTMRDLHDFEVVNVSLSHSHECFGSDSSQHILPLGGVDAVILNYVMYSTRQPGFMVTKGGDLYRWRETDFKPYSNPSEWLRYKLSILFLSLLAFFFISTLTALLVRTLISSGIALLFPILWAFQLCGMNAINLRILAVSYPWIGLPLQLIRTRSQPMEPFVIAHLTRAVLYYILYVSAQNLFIEWFYAYNSVIGQEQLYLYAIMMLWEYFSMIYMRSRMSILIFPRVVLAMFLVFHFYYYSFPMGFHLLFLAIMASASIVAMVHCIRVHETKAFRLGYVSIEQPRMLHNALPWPMWRADLAPDYTLFMPLTHLSRSIYQNAVPTRPGDQANNAPNPAPDSSARSATVHENGSEANAGGYVELRQLTTPSAGASQAPSAAPASSSAWANATSPISFFRDLLYRRPHQNYESIQQTSQHPADGTHQSSNSSSNNNNGNGGSTSPLHSNNNASTIIYDDHMS